MGFPGNSNGKQPACNVEPWVRKIPCRRAWQPTPVFLPGDPMDRGAWRATVHGIAKNQMTEVAEHACSVHNITGQSCDLQPAASFMLCPHINHNQTAWSFYLHCGFKPMICPVQFVCSPFSSQFLVNTQGSAIG